MSRTVNVNEEFVVVSKGKEDLGKFAVLGDGGKFDPSTIPVIDGLQEQVTKEVTERTEGDKVLQTNIDTETSARISDDQQLQGNIEAEASARASADKDLQDQISKEITARTDGDTALQSSVDKEVAARTDADSKLQSSIDNELDARTKADQSLQEKIDVLEGKNAFSNLVVNGTTIKATSQEDTIELEAGTNIALTADTANEKVTIAVTGKVASAAQTDSATTAESCTGNATTATKLVTARNINGVAFDGSKDITIKAEADGGNSDTVDGKHASDFISASNAYGQSLYFATNTDNAKIYFESTGDEAGESNLIIQTGDNDTESVIFRHVPCDNREIYDFCKISPNGTIVLKGNKQVATTDQVTAMEKRLAALEAKA